MAWSRRLRAWLRRSPETSFLFLSSLRTRGSSVFSFSSVRNDKTPGSPIKSGTSVEDDRRRAKTRVDTVANTDPWLFLRIPERRVQVDFSD